MLLLHCYRDYCLSSASFKDLVGLSRRLVVWSFAAIVIIAIAVIILSMSTPSSLFGNPLSHGEVLEVLQ
jgi:hypothetical protein